MSLLLLFGDHGPPPTADLTAAAAAGATAAALAAKNAIAHAAASAGASARSVGVKNATGSATAAAGATATAFGDVDARHGSAAAHAGGSGIARASRGAPASASAAAGASAVVRGAPLRIGVPLSRLTRMVVYMDPSPIAFTEQGTDEAYAWLMEISELRIAARAGSVSGIGATESNSVTAKIDNTKARASKLLGYPIKKRVDLYDREELFFSGYITGFDANESFDVTIEA